MSAPETLIPVSREQIEALHRRWEQQKKIANAETTALLDELRAGAESVSVRSFYVDSVEEWVYRDFLLTGSGLPEPLHLTRPTEAPFDDDAAEEEIERLQEELDNMTDSEGDLASEASLPDLLSALLRCEEHETAALYRELLFWKITEKLPCVADLWNNPRDGRDQGLILKRYPPLVPFPQLYLDPAQVQALELQLQQP